MEYSKVEHKLFEGMEELVRVSSCNGYDIISLPSRFGVIYYQLIIYFTLEIHYTSYHGYHFLLLNMYRHGKKVGIPFFLFSSLVNNIVLGENPYIHQGLIFVMYYHVCAHHWILVDVFHPKDLKSSMVIEEISIKIT